MIDFCLPESYHFCTPADISLYTTLLHSATATPNEPAMMELTVPQLELPPHRPATANQHHRQRDSHTPSGQTLSEKELIITGVQIALYPPSACPLRSSELYSFAKVY